jgi:hypothetical protein
MKASQISIRLAKFAHLWQESLACAAADLAARRVPNLVPLTRLLLSLPLSTSAFGTMRLRLANVRRYATAGEWGAAEFELRLLPLRTTPLYDRDTKVARTAK